MNFVKDLLLEGKRIDNRDFLEPRVYKTEVKGTEVVLTGHNTTILFSLQKVTEPLNSSKNVLRIFGCDPKIIEIYKRCFDFQNLVKKELKIYIKVRIIEGDSLEAINQGINKLIEINGVEILYFPVIKVYSLNDYILRDPSKEEANGLLVIAKAKGVIIYSEMVDSVVKIEVYLYCLKEAFREEEIKKNIEYENNSEIVTKQMIIQLDYANTPKTSENFLSMIKGETDASYKNTIFHRIIDGFMIQGGDFEKFNGTGGYSIYGKKFPDENFNLKHEIGVLSMANSGKDTNGSQFFITVANTHWLDGKHVVFGKVIKGLEVLMEISKVKVSNNHKPKRDVIIKNCGELKEEEYL